MVCAALAVKPLAISITRGGASRRRRIAKASIIVVGGEQNGGARASMAAAVDGRQLSRKSMWPAIQWHAFYVGSRNINALALICGVRQSYKLVVGAIGGAAAAA